MMIKRFLFFFLIYAMGYPMAISQPSLFSENGRYNILLLAKKGDRPEEKLNLLINRAKQDSLLINIQICSERKYLPNDIDAAINLGSKINADLVIWIKNDILNFTQVKKIENRSLGQGSLEYSVSCLIATVYSNYFYTHEQFVTGANNLQNSDQCNDILFSVQWLLAVSYYDEKDTAHAMKHAKNLLKLNSHSDFVANFIGNLYLEQGNYSMARNYFYEARAIDPENNLYLYNLGIASYKMEKWDYAYTHFKELSQVWKDSIHVLYMTGMSASQLNSYNESAIWFDKALALNDTSKILHFNQADNMQKLGKFEEAIYHYSKAIELDSNYALAYLGLAYIYADLKKKEELESYYHRAILLNPTIRNSKFEEEFGIQVK